MLAGTNLQERKLEILLVSPGAGLLELREVLGGLGCVVRLAEDAESVLCAADCCGGGCVILLDVRVSEVASGQLLAALQESGARRMCAIALIADAVSDEWIARLREGMIDDIVPRGADAATWSTHLSTMQRGHALYCELEHLRESTALEMEHDRVTGVFNRETMMSILFRETDRVQRLRGSLCMVAFAIDDLEHWAARYGPEVVDQLLREVARRTGRLLRSYDMLGRMSRDEFLLALPGCSTISAVMLTERLRVDVFGEPFAVTDGPKTVIQVRMTGSYGIASSRGRSPVVVLREAEAALDLGRVSGPDTIRCHSDSPILAEVREGEGRRLFPEMVPMLG